MYRTVLKPYHTVHNIPYRGVLYKTIPYNTVPYHAASYRTMLLYRAITYIATPYAVHCCMVWHGGDVSEEMFTMGPAVHADTS